MPVINVNGNLVRFDDDLSDDQISAEIEKNPTLFDPGYKSPVSMTDRLKGFARSEFGFDPDYKEKSLAEQTEESDDGNTPARQIKGAPVRQSFYNKSLLDQTDLTGSKETPQEGILKRVQDTASQDIKGQTQQRELEGLRTDENVPEGGFVASAKSMAGQTIRGAGRVASDYLGADKDNALMEYGAELIRNDPVAIRSLNDIKDRPFLAFKEASGNMVPSFGAMMGAAIVGQGIISAAPLTGPAAPVVAAVGAAVKWLGPAAIAALPSYSGIRDKQIFNDPKNEEDAKSKAIAALGAAAVGGIEVAFGPQNWAISMLTKEGRVALARKLAATTPAEAFVKGTLLGGLQEGSEELVQNPIEQLASYENPLTKENLEETGFGGAMGFIGGALPGGVTNTLNFVNQQAQSKADRINSERVKLGLQKIESANNVDEAIAAAQEVNSQNVTKDDVLRTEDPTLADIERLTGLKPSEVINNAETQAEATSAEILNSANSSPDLRQPNLETAINAPETRQNIANSSPPMATNNQVSGFKTEKGSTYTIDSDGRTVRNKAARPEHPGDSGIKEKSELTAYLDYDGIRALAPASGRWRILKEKDGTLSLLNEGEKGEFGYAGASARNIPIKTSPEVGLYPLELWKSEQMKGRTAYRGMHPGNKIVEITKSNDAANNKSNTEIVLPDNTALKSQWDIVDADSVKASLKEGKSQPRDRTRASSDLQIQSIANNPDYRRLSDSPIMDVGAPVLSNDGQIVGGNGRFEALSRAYDQNTAQEYLDNLRRDAVRKGLDPSVIDGMNKPVLVRRITEPFDTRKLAIASNSGTSAPYSARENAKIDSERIGDIGNLDITDSGDIALTPRNMQIIRDSMKGYTAAEQSSFVDSNGKLSQEGARRFRNAVLYNAYGDSDTLTRLIESTDNDMRNISGALMRVSGDVAKVRQEIKQGAIPQELDITDDLIGAVEKIAQLRSQNIPVQEYLAQQDIFGNGLSDDAKQIVTALHDNIRSQNKIAQFIRDVYDGIGRVNIATGDMLGNQVPSKGELIQNAKPEKAEQGKPTDSATTESGQEPAANAGNEESGAETEKVKHLFSKKETFRSNQGNLFGGNSPAFNSGASEQKTAFQRGLFESNKQEPGAKLESFKEPESQTAMAADVTINATQTKPGKIDDFGEKLGGARKDMEASLKKEYTDDDIASVPLSKIWPKEEALALEDPFMAAFAYSAREEIPTKPKVSYKVKSWVDKVKMFRGLTRMNVSGAIPKARILEFSKQYPGLEDFFNKVQVLELIENRKDWGRVERISIHPDAYKYDLDGQKIASPYSTFKVDGRSTITNVTDINGLSESVKKALSNDSPEKLMQFEIRGREGNIFINKKGDKEYRALARFATLKDARDYWKNNYDDLVAAWELVKDSDNVKKSDVRGEENRPRSGMDWRNGEDVTPELFQDTFGFRGIEFGNWVSQGAGNRDRQGMLNQAYDALMDLSSIVGVPPKAISLNGSLGLGFGSRGKGAALAHFESQNLVINLTKTKGAGNLAHEWFHALDNYFQRQRGVPTGADHKDYFITYRPEPRMVHVSGRSFMTKEQLIKRRSQNPSAGFYKAENWKPDSSHPQGVRPVVERKFSDLVNVLDDSPMKIRSQTIDQNKEDGYWSRIIERAARSFENYVIAKMMKSGYNNDYLANVTNGGDFKRNPGRYPYLLDSEIAPVEEAFDNLFSEIKTKETEKGIALFSKNSSASGLTKEDIQPLADKYNKKLTYGKIIVLNNESELPGGTIQLNQTAWHGSPHDHDKFSTANIGTGEGAQAYGYGLYFTDTKSIAEFYKDKLTDTLMPPNPKLFTVNGVTYGRMGDAYVKGDNLAITKQEYGEAFVNAQNRYELDKRNKGKLYEVELKPNEDEYLLWDKPLSEQSDKVKSALEDFVSRASDRKSARSLKAIAASDPKGETLYLALKNEYPDVDNKNKAASDYLHSIGIRGIKYLDGTSRGTGEGSYNYVIFSDNDVEIKAKYSKNTGLVEGAYVGDSKVYIIADAFDNMNRVDQVIQHELSHLAAEELLDSKEYKTAISSVNLLDKSGNKTIRDIAKIVDKRQPGLDADTRAKEILAMSVETGKYKSVSALRRVVADVVRAFKAMLRRLGVKLSIVEKMSEQEVFATMRNAMDMLYSEKNAKQTGQSESLKSAKEQIPETLNIDGIDRPTRNSNGQLIHPTEEGIRNFWKWLGDGYFLDPNGKPYVFYHQTSNDAASSIYEDGFRTDLPRARESDPRVPDGVFLKPNNNNIGIGATEESDIAQIPLYTNIKNPFIVQSAEDMTSALGDKTYSDFVESYEDTDKRLAEEFDKRWAVRNSDRKAFKSFADEYFPRAKLTLNDIASQARERLTEALQEKGYDGVIISNDKGSFGRSTKTIVATDTNQVKSATDNNGDFSKKENSILLSKSPKEGESSLDLPEETFARALQRKAQDKFNRFNVIKEFLEKEKGIKLSENADVYRAEERYHSKVTNQIDDFREKVRNPLIKKWADAGYTKEQVEEYLKNRHAEEANAQIRKLSGNETDTAYGITDEQSKEYLDKAPKELAKLADEVQAITDATQQLRLDNGIETQERVDAMRGAYKYYIPVRGDFEEQESMRGSRGPGGKGFDVRYRPKRRLGHAARNEDVIGNIFQDYERAIVQVEKNRVAKSLALMAAEIQMPDLISIDQPVKRKVLRNEKAYGVLVKGELQDIFQTKEAAEQNKRFIIASQKKVTNSDITIAPITDQRLVSSASPMLDENEVMVYMNGHEIRIQIKDDLLAQAYKNLGVESLPTILRVGRAMNGWMSKAYTGYNPEFIFTNIQRDFTAGLINLTGEEGIQITGKAISNYPSSFASLLKYAATGESNKWIDSYRANGGNTGAAYLSDLERLGEEVNGEYAAYQGVLKNLKAGDRANALRAAGRKAFNSSLKYIEHLNQAGENAFRLSAFRAMIESGKSVNEAAHIAKNVTINFNRKGEVGAELNALYLFFNANLQGTAALSHALFKGNHKYQAWGLIGGLTSLGYILGAGIGGFDDEDEYDAIGDSVKSRNIIISYGEGYVKIPVPYGAGFFYNLGRVVSEAERKDEVGKLPYQLAAIALEEFSPFNVASSEEAEFNSQKVMYGLMPTALRIPLEPASNFSTFSGREMYPEKEWYKSEPDNEKMWRNTKGTVYDITAQLLAKAGIEISPETLKYLTRTATGGSGTFVDSTVSAAMLKKEGAELETREIPFLRKAYGEVTIQDMRSRYGKAKEEAVTAAEKFNAAMRKNDLVTAKQLMGDKGELIALKNYADKLSDTIKYLRDMQDSIKLSEDYTVAEKRLKIKELEKQEEKFYNQYLDIFKTKKSEIKRRQEK